MTPADSKPFTLSSTLSFVKYKFDEPSVISSVLSFVAICEATYALIDCCDATATFESLAKLSSSRNAVPDNAPFKIGAVNVLFVSV